MFEDMFLVQVLRASFRMFFVEVVGLALGRGKVQLNRLRFRCKFLEPHFTSSPKAIQS